MSTFLKKASLFAQFWHSPSRILNSFTGKIDVPFYFMAMLILLIHSFFHSFYFCAALLVISFRYYFAWVYWIAFFLSVLDVLSLILTFFCTRSFFSLLFLSSILLFRDIWWNSLESKKKRIILTEIKRHLMRPNELHISDVPISSNER